MRVGFVVPYLRVPCGWRSLSVGAIRSLQECAGVTPVVFVNQEDAAQARRLLVGCNLIILPRTQLMGLRRPRSWLAMMVTYLQVKNRRLPQVDLVHSIEAYPTGLVGHWLAKKLCVPHVLTGVGTYSTIWHESKLDSRAYRNVLRHASAICPISQGTASMMRRYFGDAISEPGLKVVLIGADYHQRVPRKIAMQRPDSTIPTVMSVGAIMRRKGYHVSLEAFAKVKLQLPDTRYWLVGQPLDSEYYQQLRQYVADHQLHGVEFLGEISDEELRARYQRASAFILTPQQVGLKFEGFGQVYLEAGAYGLPVVATRTGGVPDAVRDGETGFIVEPDDIDGLADVLLCLLTDTQLARRMGRANRKWAETLTWERYAKEQFSVYQDLV